MTKISRINPIVEALKSNPDSIEKISVVENANHPKIRSIVRMAREKGIPLSYVPKKFLDRSEPHHQGVVAVLSPLRFVPLEEVLTRSRQPFLVLLDSITSPQNLGAIVRTAEGGGVDGIVLHERRSVGITDAVISVSAGAAGLVPISRVKNLARTMEWMKKKGIWLIGAEGETGEYWDSFDYTLPVALVFGSEGKGFRPLVREKCDALLSIPMLGQIDSLNVASAASIFIYEVVRQRMNQKTNE